MWLHSKEDKRCHLFLPPCAACLIDWRDILQEACHLQRLLRIESDALVAHLLVGDSQARGCVPFATRETETCRRRGLLSSSLGHHWHLWSYQDVHRLCSSRSLTEFQNSHQPQRSQGRLRKSAPPSGKGLTRLATGAGNGNLMGWNLIRALCGLL